MAVAESSPELFCLGIFLREIIVEEITQVARKPEGGSVMSAWQIIFSQSKVNNGFYDGDRLVSQNWEWPKETWFQNRLRDLRKRTSGDSNERGSKFGSSFIYLG